MIFGDSPTLRNNRYTPSIHAIMQSGNLYVYAINNPIAWIDPGGLFIRSAFTTTSTFLPIFSLSPVISSSVYNRPRDPNTNKNEMKEGNKVGGGSGGGSSSSTGVTNTTTLNTATANSGTTATAANTPQGTFVIGQSFSTFSAFKKHMGPAGPGMHWHHIVEQGQILKSGFNPFKVHNVNNIIRVDAVTHARITGYFNSIDPQFSSTLRVRYWLAGQSFEFQHQFGLNVLKQFGVMP